MEIWQASKKVKVIAAWTIRKTEGDMNFNWYVISTLKNSTKHPLLFIFYFYFRCALPNLTNISSGAQDSTVLQVILLSFTSMARWRNTSFMMVAILLIIDAQTDTDSQDVPNHPNLQIGEALGCPKGSWKNKWVTKFWSDPCLI